MNAHGNMQHHNTKLKVVQTLQTDTYVAEKILQS